MRTLGARLQTGKNFRFNLKTKLLSANELLIQNNFLNLLMKQK